MRNLLLMFLIFAPIFAAFSEEFEGMNYKELISRKKILNEVPKELRGIWKGKVILKSAEDDGGELEILNMCSYPIKVESTVKNWKSTSGWETYRYEDVIQSFSLIKVKGKTFYTITFLRSNNEGRILGGFRWLNYYAKNRILTEERSDDRDNIYWTMEYKYEKCPESRKN